MPSLPRLPSLLDTALDRAFIGYGNLGYVARRRALWEACEALTAPP